MTAGTPGATGAGDSNDAPDPSRAIVRDAVGMGVVTAGSRVIGFVRVLVIAAILGTTYLGNTFQASNTVSNVIFELVAAGALSAALVPGFVGSLSRGAHDDVERTANALLGVAIVVLGGVSAIAMASAPALARVLVSRAPTAAIAEQQAELTTFLLWFFIPQIVLYGIGAISIAVLQAKRRFTVPAVAPVASSVVLIASLLLFRVVAGPDPGLELGLPERLILGFGGTLAVVAFVGVPFLAARAAGVNLRPSFRWRGSGAGAALRLSWWAVVLHGGLGLLLGAALIAGNAVAGGVVAFQVAWTFFLAPYAILAQPLHTTILPELTLEADDPRQFAASLRWALSGMARWLIPVSVVMFTLAGPMMKVVAFGAADDGARLLSAALAWLAVGLFPYGALLLATRAFFALGDSRTPSVVTLFGALIGAGIMLAGSQLASGTAVVIILGIGQTTAVTTAAIALLAVLRSRLGHAVTPRIIVPVLAVSLPLGALLLWASWSWSVDGRLLNLLIFGTVGALATAAYLGLTKVWRALALPSRMVAA